MDLTFTMSVCPKCGKQQSFELVSGKLINTDIPYTFARCCSCKAVVGIMEGDHLGSMVTNLVAEINKFKDMLNQLQHEITSIKNTLAQLSR